MDYKNLFNGDVLPHLWQWCFFIQGLPRERLDRLAKIHKNEVFNFQGKMVDLPVIKRAMNMLKYLESLYLWDSIGSNYVEYNFLILFLRRNIMKKVLVPLAQGFEEAEFIGIVDVLRRAGLHVIVAGLNGAGIVKGANGVSIQADVALSDVDINTLDSIALPGGFEGMENLSNNEKVIQIIQTLHTNGKLVAAICASPIVLNKAGVLQGDFTCYPGCETGLNGKRINMPVVENGNVITSAGPATAILFGLTIAKRLCGEETYKALYDGLLLPLTKL